MARRMNVESRPSEGDGGERAPDLSVVVPSHDRPLRLRWLLNALEEQRLDRDRWEVIVVHDDAGSETEELLASHPLAETGVLRRLRLPPCGPARKRNAGWRAARGRSIVFTDDDCRPPADWLERASSAVERHGRAVIQGTTRPDPDELSLLQASPWSRTQNITPPVVWAQTCNIIYPRAVLEDADGFDEAYPEAAGEDTDLALRARERGARYVGEPDMLTYHGVETDSLPTRLRSVWRWQGLAYTVKRHPQLRRYFQLWMFWRATHLWLPVALAGAGLARRNCAYATLALPWLLHALPDYGPGPRGRLRGLSELPGLAALDLVELAALARGSVKYRTLFL